MRFSILAAGVLAASFVVLAAAGDASAQESAAFGQAKSVAISWDQPLVAGSLAATNAAGNTIVATPMTLTPIGFQYYSVSQNQGSGTVLTLAPAADFFVIDNLSIGGQVLLGFVSTSPPAPDQGRTTTLYGFAPQIGYNIVFSDLVSFWPKAFFAFAGASESNNGPSFSSGTIGIFAPFLFHIATHFYAGIGPDLAAQIFVNESGRGPNAPNPPSQITFGALGTFGGWFSL